MDYATRFRRQLAIRIFVCVFITFLGASGVLLFSWLWLDIAPLISMGISLVFAVIGGLFSIVYLNQQASAPLEMVQQIVSYAKQNTGEVPNITSLEIGRELVQALSLSVYDLAGMADRNLSYETTGTITNSSVSFIDQLQHPVIGTTADQTITVINPAACQFLQLSPEDMLGKKLFDVTNMSFQGVQTMEDWLKETSKNSVTATKSWERVRINRGEDVSPLQFDMIVGLSMGSASGTEMLISLFDKTERYEQDDQEISYVALAVHELRTPLSIMRGYIEVFQDELGKDLPPELQDFMHKMQASAQQLSAFVSNILNVARIEENQLALTLRKEDWTEILRSTVTNMGLRANVHGKHIEMTIADNLPPVAVDRISAQEVINNLLDNAIKYSDKSDKIVVETFINGDGLVETKVTDFGVGIPASVMPKLFQKFHRNHKNRMQIGGTGLGLYLSKALVSAHGGNIWVNSKEGQGSSFSFTLLPYDKLADEQKDSEDGIIRGAHGWIKNHSLYRN